MRLLKVTDREYEQLDELFDEVDEFGLEKLAPEVVQGKTDVRVNGHNAAHYDVAFLEIPHKNAEFGRVLIELIEKQGVAVNCPATAFFIMSKKNYLYYVLHEKEVNAPRTTVIASEKAARNLAQDLEPPVIGRRLENLETVQVKLLEDEEELTDFTDGVEYGDTILLFHEYAPGEDVDKYRCLVAEDQVISLIDESEGVWFGTQNLKYSNLSDDLRETVIDTVNAIGAPVAEVLISDGVVLDVEPYPDLTQYTEISGKNAFNLVEKVLRDE